MAGLIEDYSYDIFISYRQNDNKYDGWVTQFTANLRKELEATLKEKLTIFFDENPADGLLETHSVDQSLPHKLKCLIFIPVISQTYCDPKSFAWQNEFRVFNALSKKDRFGRNIRIGNNNVASRILPVMIHELDSDDKEIIENELGEKLRYIDFVYKSAGVNRPLRANEDSPRSNLNGTYYRDQINKVANAIKEIIIAILKQERRPGELRSKAVVKKEAAISAEVSGRRKIIVAALLILALIVSASIYFSGVRAAASVEKSIAVLPFRNNSPSDSNAYFINGIMEEIVNNLQQIKDLRIISRTSVEQYRNTSKSIPEISRELGVNYIVEGSGQRYGTSFKINVQLIRAKKENHLWGKLYEQKISMPGDITRIQSSVAEAIVSELKGTITPEEKLRIEKIPTTNLSAYDYYQRGNEELSKFWIDMDNLTALSNAEQLFRKALESDQEFSDAIIGQAKVLWNKRDLGQKENIRDSVLKLTDIALSYDDQLADAYVIKGWYYNEAGNFERARKEYGKAVELNPNDWKAYFGMAELYYFDDPVQSLYNLKKAASLTHGTVEMPTLLRHVGGELLVTGFIEKARDYFTRAFDLDGDSAILFSCLAGIEQNQGNYEKAIHYYEKAYSIKRNYTDVLHNLALTYQLTGNNDNALRYFRELEKNNSMNFNMHRFALACYQKGLNEEAERYFSRHLDHCSGILKNVRRSDILSYTYYDLAGIYAHKGDRKRAYQNLRMLNRNENCFLYMVTLIRNDPFFESIKTEPEFLEIIDNMESKYARVHDAVGKWLEDQEGF